MEYKIVNSNSAVNVIEVDGQIIQLSASINIDDYLSNKYFKTTDHSTEEIIPQNQKRQKENKRKLDLDII